MKIVAILALALLAALLLLEYVAPEYRVPVRTEVHEEYVQGGLRVSE